MTRTRSWLAIASALLLLAACASPPATRFHSLLATEPPPHAHANSSRVSWELGRVDVPAQVDRPQMVLRLADDSLAVLEQDRWIAPLRDELRAALAERLSYRLGPPGAGSGSTGGVAAHWRIDVQVLRFDSVPAAQARIVADWTLRGVDVALTCRSSIDVAAVGSISGLVQAHQRAVERLADAIARGLDGSRAGQAPGCM